MYQFSVPARPIAYITVGVFSLALCWTFHKTGFGMFCGGSSSVRMLMCVSSTKEEFLSRGSLWSSLSLTLSEVYRTSELNEVSLCVHNCLY